MPYRHLSEHLRARPPRPWRRGDGRILFGLSAFFDPGFRPIATLRRSSSRPMRIALLEACGRESPRDIRDSPVDRRSPSGWAPPWLEQFTWRARSLPHSTEPNCAANEAKRPNVTVPTRGIPPAKKPGCPQPANGPPAAPPPMAPMAMPDIAIPEIIIGPPNARLTTRAPVKTMPVATAVPMAAPSTAPPAGPEPKIPHIGQVLGHQLASGSQGETISGPCANRFGWAAPGACGCRATGGGAFGGAGGIDIVPDPSYPAIFPLGSVALVGALNT